MAIDVQLSTGVPGLDRLLRGLIAGDNLVWQVDAIEHFAPFVPPYCRHALRGASGLSISGLPIIRRWCPTSCRRPSAIWIRRGVSSS